MRTILTTTIVLLLAHGLFADEQATKSAQSDADKRPTRIWDRTGPLGETPKHVTDAYPLSDQKNEGGWARAEPLSDDFDGQDLDLNKWTRGLGWWKGRQPALFSNKNVTVSDGKLHLTMRKEKVLVRSVENTHWHQPLYMIFDSETMPNWFGMPKDEDLASTYTVEYVRAWKRQNDSPIKTVINGVTVADYDGAGRLDDETHRAHNVGMKGQIGLQIHSGKQLLIRLKDIEVRML